MTHSMYWLEVDGDRIGLEVLVNVLVAERLMKTHGARLPINEYLVPGLNRLELRRGLWPSNKEPTDGGEASLKLVRATFQNSVKLAEETLADAASGFELCPPGTVMVAASFAADEAPAPPPLGGFDPVAGRTGQALILDQLELVAGYWRTGDAHGLIRFMSSYLDDYVRAYPLETRPGMEAKIRRMAGAFKGEPVEFDRNAVRLSPVPGSNLVDAISPRGAAIHIARREGPPYDMWSTLGLRGGEVVLVR